MYTTHADTSERRFEIQCKLEAELASLEALKEAEERSRKLTNNVVGILSSLEQRLATLRRTILPVYNETGNLQAQQQNIERTLTTLDHAIGYYGVCQDVEPSIRSGPSNPSTLSIFLDSLNRLHLAQRYFQKNNPSSVELENISSLYALGLDLLLSEFQDILTRHSKPVLPIILLDVMEGEAELNLLSEGVIRELRKLAEWLEERGHRRHVRVYASVRAGVVLRSLQMLREHQKTSSGGSGHAGSPLPRPKFRAPPSPPSRRPRSRLQHVLERKASKMFRAPQVKREDAPDEQEMENYLLLTVGLNRLMMAERAMGGRVLGGGLQTQVLEATVRDAMDLVAQDGESIAARARRCIARRDFSAVLVIFPILKHLGDLKPDLERTVEGCDYALRSKFRGVLNMLNVTGAKALDDFAETLRSDTASILPKDGTVAEVTSNVLVFLEQLAEYADTAGAVLADAENMGKQGENGRNVLGIYVKKVLAQLNLSLISRSDAAYSDPALRCLFRLNNHNHVVNALRRSSLMELLLLAEPSAEHSYNDFIKRDKAAYVAATFAKAKGFLENEEPELNAKMLKEKFLGFTREFEELSKLQRQYSVPDAKLREELRKELQQAIQPLYATFHNKYRGINFTKNPQKYIKYTPEQIGGLVLTFFDTTA